MTVGAAFLGCRRFDQDRPSARPGEPGEAQAVENVAKAVVSKVVVLDGLLELPTGFQAVVLQRAGDPMDDGHRVPPQPDGMTCIGLPDGRWALLRNHELSDAAWAERQGLDVQWLRGSWPSEAYRPDRFGGVVRAVIDPGALASSFDGREHGPIVIGTHAVLAGTDTNCAGGAVEIDGVGGWVSCEESDDPDHGWAFLTRADDDGLVDAGARRLTSWGRFKREAVAVDARTGIAYMTEDHPHGLLYRHVPDDPKRPFGAGVLQALRIEGLDHTDPHLVASPGKPVEPLVVGTRWETTWVPIEDSFARSRPCREQGRAAGATRFNRGEGIARDPTDGAVVFVASLAGPARAGQIYRLMPEQDILELIAQVEDRTTLSMPDNVTVSPWGDLILCEDNYDRRGVSNQFVRGLRPDGSLYDIARNLDTTHPKARRAGVDLLDVAPGAEFTGCCFSPDGEVLFVNLQAPIHATVAIRGNWASLIER